MSEKPERKSHAMAWALSIVVAVPLFYLLSVPWIAVARFKMGYPMAKPGLFGKYCGPWNWASQTHLLRNPLTAYTNWCWKIAGER
jgi:hypothetical protein